MQAEVIAIGDELTSGQRLDTNSQWLSQRLTELGLCVVYHTTVADDLAANVAAFRVAIDRADLVVCTGGLGPTADDLTRPALAEETLNYAGIALDPARRKVTRQGRPVHLGPTDFQLLLTLMERPGRVFSRSQLLDRVWGHEVHVEDRTVDVHIRRLRKALNAHGGRDLIRTVRGAGYAIDEQGQE